MVTLFVALRWSGRGSCNHPGKRQVYCAVKITIVQKTVSFFVKVKNVNPEVFAVCHENTEWSTCTKCIVTSII